MIGLYALSLLGVAGYGHAQQPTYGQWCGKYYQIGELPLTHPMILIANG